MKTTHKILHASKVKYVGFESSQINIINNMNVSVCLSSELLQVRHYTHFVEKIFRKKATASISSHYVVSPFLILFFLSLSLSPPLSTRF